jgi:signal transduction histidine kinase
MRKCIRNLGWLVCVAPILGLVSGATPLAGNPAVHQAFDFHHTGWGGLGAVFDLKLSSEGYLWLTTSKGVLRFDGVRFQSVEEVTHGAVQDSEIDSVFIFSSGGLWFTTQGAGLLFWKDGRLTTFPDRRCTPVRKQGKIIEDRDGSLWVQATAGLFRLRGSVCEQIGPEQGYPGGFPAGIFLDSDGTLWVKTRTSPLLFLPRGESKFQITNVGEGLSTGHAYLHEAPDGAIWLSDNQGLRSVASKLSASASSPPKQYKSTLQFGDFTFAPDGALWAITGKGVRRFEHVEQWPAPVAVDTVPGEVFTPQQGLSSDAVWNVLADREGVWIGTNSGLDRLRRVPLTTLPLPRAQEHEYSVAAGDNDSVWTGNNSLPLTHVAADGTTTSYPRTRQTISVRRDHNGTIWSAGEGEFHLWRSSGKEFLPLHYPEENLDPVIFVATDRNNAPWITTASGRAYKLSDGKWSDETQTLGKKPGVRGAMVDDRAANVWFAFSNKVVRWDGSTYHTFSFPDGAPGVSENTMYVRGDHVWLAGARGVQLFTSGQFYLMHWKDRDLPGRLSGIVETEAGDLWMNGFSGITHVPSSELKLWLDNPSLAVSGERFTELDGLPGLSGEMLPEPSVIEAPNGRLWFATTKGIAWLDPTTLERNRHRLPPSAVISTVIANGQTYADSKTVTLPARNETLEIDYTAPSLDNPERVFFRYRLDGVDTDWQDVGARREAYYTKLGPGQYRFHVIASNNDGDWNQGGSALDFAIAPAYYQTLWFRLTCASALAILLWVIHEFRVRGIEQRYLERKQAEEALRRARAELEHVNRVATMGELTASLAHELNQPIGAAVNDANACVRWLARDTPDVEEARGAAARTMKDARRAADIISRIRLLFKKGIPQRELVDVNEIIHEIIVLLQSEATRYSIAIRTELGEVLPLVMGDRVQLQQVIMNLTMNSIEATKNVEGAREIAIRSQQGAEDQVLVCVSDTGVGLPPQQTDQIFQAFFTTKPQGTGMGLAICRSIVDSHGGRLWAGGNSPRSASFSFTLPVQEEAQP